MAFEHRLNSGSLRKNDRKEKDTHPDYRGDANINGVAMWMNAWLKKDKNGNTYMSFAFKPKDGTASNRRTESKVAEEEAPW